MKLLLGVVAGALSACGAPSVEHVSLAPVPPVPPPEQRVWIFNALTPSGQLTEVTTTCWSHGGCNTTRKAAIQLADGRIVRDPEDLSPVVAPDSPTLVHAHRATRASSHARWWGGAAIAALVGGIIIVAEANGTEDRTALTAGLTLAVAGIIIGATGSYIEREHVLDERRAAFASYPHDLATRLSLCVNGETLVPCEQNAPGVVAPPPPDPGVDQLRQR